MFIQNEPEKESFVSKFGTFSIRRKKSRVGRNPKTREPKIISSRDVVLFKPSKEFKEFINNKNESENLGTDFYDSDLKKVKTLPYKHNYGYFFSSGPNTWHGMEKKEIVKERRCLQVNYVTFNTDWPVY